MLSRLGTKGWWLLTALALKVPLFWLMVYSPWGLRADGLLTYKTQIAALLLLALITFSVAWMLGAPRRRLRHLQRALP